MPISAHAFGKHPLLRIVWVLISILLLAAILFFNYEHNINKTQNSLQEAAQLTQNETEELLDDFIDIIFSLPLFGKKLSPCPELHGLLDKILFKYPNISGLAITDGQKKLVCSTLSTDIQNLFSKWNLTRPISGPYFLKKHENPFFIFHEQTGDYHIYIFFLQSVLDNALKKNNSHGNLIFLYDYKIHRILAKSGVSFHSSNVLKYPAGTSKLQTIDDLEIVVKRNPLQLLKKQIVSGIIISVIFLSISLLLYGLINKAIIKRYSLQGLLEYAMKNQQFFPLFQPIYDLKNKRFSGAEVLLRWRTKENETIMPEAFIDVAEKTGVIVPITLQIADIALEVYSKILKPEEPFYLGFNLSAHHFTSNTFFNDFMKLLEKHHVSPSQILLELTERDIIDKNDSIFSEKMSRLREHQFSLAIDDFGTGYSNISYLQHFPFNYLKIDKFFVHSIGTGSITESLIDTIISMGQTLNLSIIAEGVENKEQLEYLVARGVHYIQGWHFAKPMSANVLALFLLDPRKII